MLKTSLPPYPRLRNKRKREPGFLLYWQDDEKVLARTSS